MKYPAVDPGFRRGHEWWVWGGVGGAVGFLPDMKSRGGGGGGGAISFGPDTEKKGRGV